MDYLTSNNYGYRKSPGGFIDDWRPVEFPALLPPLSNSEPRKSEIYFDYAGAALPTHSQLQAIFRRETASVLANPHSSGPAASRTLLGVQKAKLRTLEHLDALPGRFAALKDPPLFASPGQCHSGYEVVFTSGTTEGLRQVADRFPWKPKCRHCHRQSLLLYAQNSHTSVLGMRNLAMEQGAGFDCRDVADLACWQRSDYQGLQKNSDCGHCTFADYRCLLVIPAECNFGGTRPDVERIVRTAREAGWSVLVDIAKAAATGPISLKQIDPDFAVLSFYKLFGAPTGVGALLVKRSSMDILFEDSATRNHYQGGGSVDIMLPTKNVCVPRSERQAAFANGTIHFRGILSLKPGFDELKRRGGMRRIHKHASSLARELVRRLESLRHRNGRKVVRLYGAWANPEMRVTAGPTVPFNVIREDGSYVGYNEVSKLAALHYVPMQFRTGCFCNPGECQKSLGLSEGQALENFEQTGHVCGDHIDLVAGHPTGAIRISFGKDSLWEDLDVFVLFLERTFVSTPAAPQIPQAHPEETTRVGISQLFIFPIKSCAAHRVQRWKIEKLSGKMAYDREFALVDSSGTAMRLQSFPKMTTITPSIDVAKQTMTLSAPGAKDLVVDISDQGNRQAGANAVKVCGNRCSGRLWGDHEVSEWFSTYLGVQCWLARHVDGQYQRTASTGNGRSGFANEQALLLVSENAVDTLNEALRQQNQAPVGARHFRPNIVIKGHQPSHVEDEWQDITLIRGKMKFETRGTCARCAMVDYDPVTGKKGKTLRALAQYRRRHGKICFGIFLRAIATDEDESWIEEGDELQCR